MSNSYRYSIKQVENILCNYNEMINDNLKDHSIRVDNFITSIDNGSGHPAKEIYIGVELDGNSTPIRSIHEIFSSVEKSIRIKHKMIVYYYIRNPLIVI